MSEVQKQAEAEIPLNNVVEFSRPLPHPKRQAQLTDLELVAVREMMLRFSIVATHCPVAMRVLKDADLL